jgi:hypothetical protein
MAVTRPPSTRQAALDLAEAHFAYCRDGVLQGHTDDLGSGGEPDRCPFLALLVGLGKRLWSVAEPAAETSRSVV